MNPTEFRRHLHAHPELSFKEHDTAAFIADRLTELSTVLSPERACWPGSKDAGKPIPNAAP